MRISVLMLLIILTTAFSGCAKSSRDMDSAEMDSGYNVQETQAMEKYSGSNDGIEIAFEEAKSISGSGTAYQTNVNLILAQRKIIRNANLTIEVENFNEAYGKINTMISTFGFVESSNISKDKVYIDGEETFYTSGVIVIRVDKDKFDMVMKDLNGLGTVLDERIFTDDITSQYFDIESRLKLLKLEEERILGYLEDIEDPEVVFRYESRLTEIRHEIESMTGMLNKWDVMVSLSTITINLREERVGDGSKPKDGFFERLIENFLSSMEGVIDFLGNFIVFFAGIFPALMLMGIIALIVLIIVKKGKSNKKP